MAKSTWSFGSPGQLVFGRNSVNQLESLVQRHGWKQVLVVTDSNLLNAGVVEPVTQALAAGGAIVSIFSEGEAEPAIAVAEAR